MTAPDELRPSDAIAVEDAADSQSLNQRIWSLRLAGAVLLVAVWLTVSVRDIGSTYFIVETVVFGILGTYGFLAAAASRGAAVRQEAKLRLRLLVRNMELEKSAKRDDLTQLFNRRYLFEQLERELQTAKESNCPLAVVIADLDSFTSINSAFGHRMGDKALSQFGRLLLDQARASDVPGRIGSDEFAIILPDTSERGAQSVVERLSAGLDNTDLIDNDGLAVPLTACFGISGYPWGGDTVNGIIQHATASLYAYRQPDEGAVPAIFRKSLESLDDDFESEEPQA